MTRIDDPLLHWDEDNTPFSSTFDDVYYNRKSGLEESRLVYLDGNNLPLNWQDKDHFTIAETGFGTGLNFLATCEMFERTAPAHARLDYISIERYPLHKDDLARTFRHMGRNEAALPHIPALLRAYPPRFPGFHRRWITDRITLTLIFDDAERALAQLTYPVDAWFLDGFTPKKNPAMWQKSLFGHMARLSHQGTTLASFSAAGDVRRGLAEAGFTVQRLDGFGYKYHRTIGTFNGAAPRPVSTRPPHVTIIGAGLAGAGAAYALARRGVTCTVLEKENTLGVGASGNQCGLINPKLEAQDNPRNDIGQSAFSFTNHLLSQLDDVEYRPMGANHFELAADRADRLSRVAKSAGWLPPHLQLHADGSAFFPDAATVSPRKLVPALLSKATLRFNAACDTLPTKDHPVILASGYALHHLFPELQLQPVRGQVTYVAMPAYHTDHLQMFRHYIAPMTNGNFAIGATFERDNDDPNPRDADDAENIAAIRNAFPKSGEISVTDRWAGVRSATRDRFPFVGPIPSTPHIYLSGGLGSHGIQFGLLHGEILASMICNEVPPIGKDALATLAYKRFCR